MTSDTGQFASDAEYSAFLRWKFRRADARNRLEVLTERESEVAILIATGDSNKEIGVALSISDKTVEKHRANAIRKLECRGTAELIQLVTIAEI